MHESDEASYYEIALTNSQVLVAFVILLVCMLIAFFAGLWAGRGGQLVAGPPDPVEQLAEIPPPAEDGLEEFTFFSDAENQEGEDAEVESLSEDPETTLIEDVGGELPPAQDPKPPAPTPPRKRTVQDENAPSNPAIPRVTARQPTKAVGGQLYVQVLSVRERRQARKVLQQLLDAGYGAFLSPIQVEDQTMYRVRIGPFTTRPAAADVAERVRQTFKLESWITS